jgi:hypothetical protein
VGGIAKAELVVFKAGFANDGNVKAGLEADVEGILNGLLFDPAAEVAAFFSSNSSSTKTLNALLPLFAGLGMLIGVVLARAANPCDCGSPVTKSKLAHRYIYMKRLDTYLCHLHSL